MFYKLIMVEEYMASPDDAVAWIRQQDYFCRNVHTTYKFILSHLISSHLISEIASKQVVQVSSHVARPGHAHRAAPYKNYLQGIT